MERDNREANKQGENEARRQNERAHERWLSCFIAAGAGFWAAGRHIARQTILGGYVGEFIAGGFTFAWDIGRESAEVMATAMAAIGATMVIVGLAHSILELRRRREV